MYMDYFALLMFVRELVEHTRHLEQMSIMKSRYETVSLLLTRSMECQLSSRVCCLCVDQVSSSVDSVQYL